MGDLALVDVGVEGDARALFEKQAEVVGAVPALIRQILLPQRRLQLLFHQLQRQANIFVPGGRSGVIPCLPQDLAAAPRPPAPADRSPPPQSLRSRRAAARPWAPAAGRCPTDPSRWRRQRPGCRADPPPAHRPCAGPPRSGTARPECQPPWSVGPAQRGPIRHALRHRHAVDQANTVLDDAGHLFLSTLGSLELLRRKPPETRKEGARRITRNLEGTLYSIRSQRITSGSLSCIAFFFVARHSPPASSQTDIRFSTRPEMEAALQQPLHLHRLHQRLSGGHRPHQPHHAVAPAAEKALDGPDTKKTPPAESAGGRLIFFSLPPPNRPSGPGAGSAAPAQRGRLPPPPQRRPGSVPGWG